MSNKSFVSINPEDLSKKEAYLLFISSIIPRPIALVSSIDENQTVNVAPFSYFSGISSKPALISISIARKPEDLKKDTLCNIETQKEFCVNICNVEMADGVEISASNFPPDESEMNHNGFSLVKSEVIKPPGIAEAPLRLECGLFRNIDDLGSVNLIIGEVKRFIIDESVLGSKGRPDSKLLNPLCRLGGKNYSSLASIFTAAK